MYDAVSDRSVGAAYMSTFESIRRTGNIQDTSLTSWEKNYATQGMAIIVSIALVPVILGTLWNFLHTKGVEYLSFTIVFMSLDIGLIIYAFTRPFRFCVTDEVLVAKYWRKEMEFNWKDIEKIDFRLRKMRIWQFVTIFLANGKWVDIGLVKKGNLEEMIRSWNRHKVKSKDS